MEKLRQLRVAKNDDFHRALVGKQSSPVLIDLIVALKKQSALWSLIIVGIPGGETVTSLKSYAEKLGVAAQVRVHEKPSEAEIAALIGQASYIASASRYEGFGISVIEGLSADLCLC